MAINFKMEEASLETKIAARVQCGKSEREDSGPKGDYEDSAQCCHQRLRLYFSATAQKLQKLTVHGRKLLVN
jgi:hypothetical protein